MGENKTQRTAASVDAVIQGIADDARRNDCLLLLAMMRKVTGIDPVVWSSGVVGFGTFHYKSASGREGDWFPVGFSPRKANLTVYLGLGLEHVAESLSRLGKFKAGKGCIYIKRLTDVDFEVLRQIVADSYAHIRQMYG
jgi:hypothetical protein